VLLSDPGRYDEIVAYNECDAITTYLIWLRTAHLGGFVSREGREQEDNRLEDLLGREVGSGRPHLGRYLEEWRRCRTR
jgi:3'-5' exonuclease